jgi:hypothetical protein
MTLKALFIHSRSERRYARSRSASPRLPPKSRQADRRDILRHRRKRMMSPARA